MDEHKSKIVHKLVETLCLVMETPDSKMGKISEDIVPKSTFTSLKEGMDMEEKDSIFSKMKLGEDKSKSKTFSLDLDKEDEPEEKSLMDMKDKPLMDMKDKPLMDMGKGNGSSIPPPPIKVPSMDMDKGNGTSIPPPPPTPKVEEPEDKPLMIMDKDKEPPKGPLIMNADTKQIEPPKMMGGSGGRRKRTKRKSRKRKSSRKRISRRRR